MGLEAVELIMAIEETFGISITDAEGAAILTPADLIRTIESKVRCADPAACPTQKAFHRLRRAMCETLHVARASVVPEAALSSHQLV
jgi:hypothetical protein